MKIVCIGRNYAEHASELGNAVPTEPVLFMKPETALYTSAAPYPIPAFTKDLHFECELVLVIDKKLSKAREAEALDAVNQITLGIDFTARDVQERLKAKQLSWEKAKAFDGAAVVAARKLALANLPALDQLEFELVVNGERRQLGKTALMLFSPARLLAEASQYFTLEPGDLVFTGTPAGVGPVASGDRLEGNLMGEKLLDFSIA